MPTENRASWVRLVADRMNCSRSTTRRFNSSSSSLDSLVMSNPIRRAAVYQQSNARCSSPELIQIEQCGVTARQRPWRAIEPGIADGHLEKESRVKLRLDDRSG